VVARVHDSCGQCGDQHRYQVRPVHAQLWGVGPICLR